MLKRAWLVLSILWALCEILAGPFDADSFGKLLAIGFAPLALGVALIYVGRFVFTGSFRKPRVILYP